MYNIHPTIIEQNSNFYYESAKLSCILNDISFKQESIITQSAPETGRKGVGFGTVEGARWVGRYDRTPPPEAYEPRVVFAELSLKIYRGCEHEGVFINLTIQLKNAPSSEPDELSTLSIIWLTAYPLVVLKPIKDGINGWLNGINKAMIQSMSVLLDDDPNNDDQFSAASGANNVLSKLFVGGVFEVFIGIMIVLGAIYFITFPFIGLVSTLVDQLIEFIKPMIISAIIGGIASTFNELGWISDLLEGNFEGFGEQLENILSSANKGKSLFSTSVQIFSAFVLVFEVMKLFMFSLEVSLNIASFVQHFVGIVLAIFGLILAVVPGNDYYDVLGFALAIAGTAIFFGYKHIIDGINSVFSTKLEKPGYTAKKDTLKYKQNDPLEPRGWVKTLDTIIVIVCLVTTAVAAFSWGENDVL